MNEKLYNQLNEAYTAENLNRITAKIIEFYRNRQFAKIENIISRINEICRFPESKINKYFSQLVFLYHPDKLNHYKNLLNKYLIRQSDTALFEISHILITQKEINKKADLNPDNPMIMDGFEMEFGFDEEDIEDIDNWNVYDLHGHVEEEEIAKPVYLNDFLTTLKIKELGSASAQLQEYELKNLDGHLELAGMELDDLTGIDLCTNLKSLDLSENSIIDITLLGYLHSLTVLDISGNAIDDISALIGLINLETLDLAFNNIDDIEPLLELPRLKYVNLIGNSVPDHQIEKLKENDLIVLN